MLKWSHRLSQFQHNVSKHLDRFHSSRVVLASAWLVSDNVIVDLFRRTEAHKHFPVVVGIDTLHLFDQTVQVAQQVQDKYDFQAKIYKPLGCERLQDFHANYGTHQTLSHADFDKHSKVDPLRKAFQELNKEVVITGRRADQGNERITLDVWEADKLTFNPLADWTWEEITQYVLDHQVPYNALHRRINIADRFVDPTERQNYKFKHVELEKPFFAYSHDEIKSHGPFVYVWKSFGDKHSSVPVDFTESERAGRFIGQKKTECGIHTRIDPVGAPHGGKLVDLFVKPGEENIVDKTSHVLELSERQVCDLECLAVGGFSPLAGFMTKNTYDHVVAHTRLPEGQLFGLPVTLDTDSESIKEGDYVLLKSDKFGGDLGVLHVQSKWIPDKASDSVQLYGTDNLEHPAVKNLVSEKKKYNIGGPVWALKLPQRNWVECLTPKAIRARNASKNVIAFQSRNPLHRAHVSMLLAAANKKNATVLVHPVIGPTKGDDVPAIIRKETYDALAKILKEEHPDFDIQFEYLPYNMVVGGPREALQHAIVRKNYGCTGIVIGRDHAGCKDAAGNDFYGPNDALDYIKTVSDELGMEIVGFEQMVYVEEENRYVQQDYADKNGLTKKSISGTKFRSMMSQGLGVPEWFAYPEVVEVLRKYYKSQQELSSEERV